MTPHCLWHLQRTCLKAIRTLKQHDSNKKAADPDHQEATSCGYQILEAWSWFPGRLWRAVATISTGPDSQNQSVIPGVSLCTGVHQVYKWYLLAPGTNIAHHLASLETITCFEMCSCLKTVFMTVMTVMMQFVKFSVLQFIFYNHCDVIKVVSLSQGSYPQYQAPGAHRSRLH